jgi:hypothetical protein
MRRLNQRLVRRALVVLVGAKTTLLQIPESHETLIVSEIVT